MEAKAWAVALLLHPRCGPQPKLLCFRLAAESNDVLCKLTQLANGSLLANEIAAEA